MSDPATIRSLVAAVRERDELRAALNDAAQDAHDASTQGHVHRGESYLACPAPSCAKRAVLHREDGA